MIPELGPFLSAMNSVSGICIIICSSLWPTVVPFVSLAMSFLGDLTCVTVGGVFFASRRI